MDEEDMRFAVAFAVVAATLWRGRIDGQLPEYWWKVWAAYFVLLFLVGPLARIYWSWRFGREAKRLAALDDSGAASRASHIWPAAARAEMLRLVGLEGSYQRDADVERFPAMSSEVRWTSIAFWISLVLTLGLVGALYWYARRVNSALAVSAWAIVAVLTLSANRLRQRAARLQAVLEVAPDAVALVAPDGQRLRLRWTDGLQLRRRNWPLRWEISSSRSDRTITVDYARVGVERAMRRIVTLAGLAPKADTPDVPP